MNCTCGASIGHPLVPECTCKPKKMRELTNEEIMEVANEVFNTYKNWGYYQIDFARAILKCASGNILSDNEVKD